LLKLMAGGGLAGANQVLLMMDEATAAVQDTSLMSQRCRY
jgi:hypothetical protein